MAEELVVQAVGDVRIRARPHQLLFSQVASELERCDVLFGNCESAYEPSADEPHRCGRDCVFGTMQRAGFHVMSCANNRFGDLGPDPLRSTLRMLHAHDIATCGAGDDKSAARAPAIVEAGGRRLAFLAFTAVRDPEGKADIRQIANLHPRTTYEDVEPNQPGTPPRIRTSVDHDELAAVVRAVREAKAAADLVLVSFHWGIHLIPFVIADYERQLAHAAVDAGADAVLGHHQHVIKPIELYRGRPILYGLGNFANFVAPDNRGPHSHDPLDAALRFGEYRSRRYKGTWNRRPARLRIALIARLTFAAGRSTRVEAVPCRFDRTARPIACPSRSVTGRRVLSNLREGSEMMGFTTRYVAMPDSDLISVAS